MVKSLRIAHGCREIDEAEQTVNPISDYPTKSRAENTKLELILIGILMLFGIPIALYLVANAIGGGITSYKASKRTYERSKDPQISLFLELNPFIDEAMALIIKDGDEDDLVRFEEVLSAVYVSCEALDIEMPDGKDMEFLYGHLYMLRECSAFGRLETARDLARSRMRKSFAAESG